MKPRAVLFFIGVILAILGVVPLLAAIIPPAQSLAEGLPPAGSAFYQGILIILAVVALSYAIRGEGKKKPSKEELLKALTE